MIRSASLALSRMTERERSLCRFVVIGDTPADFAIDHLAECRELAAELGVDRQIHFLDFRADVKPYISDFDIGVVPSVYPDPLPRAVLEIMAFGIPVIAFDVGGVAEMLDNSAGTRCLCRIAAWKNSPGNSCDICAIPRFAASRGWPPVSASREF